MAIQCFTNSSSLHFPEYNVIMVNEISVHVKTHLLNMKIYIVVSLVTCDCIVKHSNTFNIFYGFRSF